MSRGRPQILYVEDSAVIGRMLAESLDEQGVTVHLADTGDQALSWLAEHAGELSMVLCDHGLPDTTGLELMHRIREQFPDLRLVLTTGFAGPDIERRAAAFDGLLIKPFDTAAVTAFIGDDCPDGAGLS
ncbi:MAG: response regulator [Pseudomonadota bacterium]